MKYPLENLGFLVTASDCQIALQMEIRTMQKNQHKAGVFV
jgi:hypothetical protein